MTNDIGFLTSFSPDLFNATGRELLDSYKRVDRSRYFLACTEGQPASLFSEWGIDTYDLQQDEFLNHWLQANRDIIPDYLGGDAKECDCPGHEERHAKHKPRCHWQWMNRNASRFFRKVAAWRYAAERWKQRYMVWLDSDCFFIKRLQVENLVEMAKGAAVCYFQGRREAPETGIILFDLEAGACRLIDKVCDCYTSGQFRNEPRWDDGYIFGRMVEKRLGCKDLVNRKTHRGNNVIPQTAIAAYFTHLKGSHGTRLNIMK